MSPEQLIQKLNGLSAELRKDCAEIIAETATEYFRGSFTRKAFDGKPWKRTNKSTGSTLVESSNLMGSIRPITVTEQAVVIAAGNEKVAYARTHNEGIRYIRPHKRTSKLGKRYNVRGYTNSQWKRQFIGNSKEMFEQIGQRIDGYIATQLNK
jgi:phage gpG-like protein